MPRKPELGKYLLWQLFARNQTIRKHLPDTARYSAATLNMWLKKYTSVYIKPSAGSRGRGIYKIWRQNKQYWLQHTTHAPRKFSNLTSVHRYIQAGMGSALYIIQQGIQLATIAGQPYDIRVMMQRSRMGGRWLYSGMIAKVAGKGSIVTNIGLSHGRVLEVSEALNQSLHCNKQAIRNYRRKLIQLSSLVASHFDSYQKYRELGLDLAIDTSGRIWLIEENTGPSHQLFAKLTSNLDMYHTIQRRARQYRLSH